VRTLLAAIIAASTLSAVAAPAALAADSSTATVHVGALLSITGGGSTLGNTSKVALRVAVAKWNAQPAAKRGNAELVLDVYNTNLEPDRAVTGIKALAKKGAHVVIGPQSSSEVAAIKDLAASLGVLVVSQGSTASSLAIPNDNVFRFVPTDHVEGKAITDLMVKDGATELVPMWRNDAGNQGLSDTVRSTAPASGANVTAGYRYEPDTTDFTTGLAAITTQVNDAVATVGVDHVAVYLAGFEETADVLAAAKAIPDLAGVRWYGGDGSAQATALIRNKNGAAFAVSAHGYPSPLVALPADRATKDAALIASISKKAKAPADAFTLAAYDALNVAAKALVAVGKGPDNAALQSAFTTAADGYDGVTGTIELDAAGDRTTAPYAFWSICATGASGTSNGPPKWLRTGLWEPAADLTVPATLTSDGCPVTLTFRR
jgi:branched-chain amino acid transport system substrate-binding protein